MMSGTIRTKSDVDRHVNQLLLKVRNENERNLRCYHIAQLYFKIQDFTSARHYIQLYLTVRDDSAAAHKLLGQCCEQLGKKREAVAAYTKSLKIEADQSDLILKMCELLCDKECDFESGLARYWWERASALFPHSPPVFKLKEKIMSTDTNISSTDYEDLLHAELKARPTDITVRMKLLKLYAESGRSEAALTNAFDVESRQIHGKSLEWYQCVNDICNIYFRESYAKCGWEFYVQWLSTIDKLCSLSLSEVSSSGSDLAQATNAVFSLDQKIFKSTNQITEGSELYQEFMKYVSAQLVFHLGVLLMKLAKKDISLWKEIKRWLGPLFLLATTESPSMEKVCSLSIKDGHRKQLNGWIHQANCRLVQAGHILLALSKDTQSDKLFIDRINHQTSGDWRRQVFERAFRSIDDRNSLASSSYFVNVIEFSKLTQTFPSINHLKPSLFVSSFENIYLGSLHHMVWLGLQSLEGPFSILNAKIPKSFHSMSFRSLQFTTNNLNNVGVETINQLDLDSFLYATVFCTGVILDEQKANGFYPLDRPSVFPVDISPPLCSAEQSKWWWSVWSLVKSGTGVGGQTNNETVSDLRHTVQRGLEVVRGGQGLSLPLIVLLARTVANRGSGSDRNEEMEGCESRALYLWETALPMLERLASNKTVIAMTEKKIIFEYPAKDLTPQEISALVEEGKYFVARHYMNKQQYEKAVDVFKCLKSPHAAFCLALIYQKLAEEQTKGQHRENLTSEMRCRYVVHATKARNCLTSVREMIKGDPNHSLQPELKGRLAEVEDMLARIEPDNGNYEGDGNCVDGSASYGSVGSGGDVVQGISSIQHPTPRPAFPHSTPKKYFEQKHSRLNTSEIIELLNVTQSTNQLKISQVLEQSRLVLDKLENVMYEQRNQFRSLTNRFNNFETEMKNTIAEMKKELKQRSDLYNVLDEDDYTDEILQYQNYPAHNFYPAPGQTRAMPSTSATVPLAAPQYFSPPMYQGNLGFYNQGALPFGDGQQQLPDFLRASGQQQVVQKPLQPLINLQGPLNLGPPGSGAGVLGGPPKLPLAAPHNVVITTSDTLPTGVPPVQPALSVTIPAHHRLGTLPPPQVPVSLPPSFPSVTSSLPPPTSSPIVPHNFQIPLPADQPKAPSSSLSLVLNASEERYREEDELPSATYDPLPDFQPIVPLPDEVEVRTGEEDEEVVFERRAKLFRFVGTEWKERGIGNLKILKDKDTGKNRILMRREVVHKICANHFLTPDMILEPKLNAENAWIWVAHDYADEKVEVEKFCVKFKTAVDSASFKETFDKVKVESSNIPCKAIESKRPETTATTGAPGTRLFSFSQTNRPPLLSTPLSQAGSVVSTPVMSSAKPLSNQKHLFSTPTDTSKIQTVSTVGKEPSVGDQTTTKVGGFSFSLSQPKFKVPEVEETKPETTKPSPFFGFSFPFSKTDSTSSQNPFANIGKAVDDSSKKNVPGFSFSFNSSVDKGGIFDLGKTSNLFSTPNVSVPRKADVKVAEKETTDVKNDSTGHEDDFVPTAIFTPVVEMPQIVPVVTGEENEEVLYEEQAKLYRYCKETKQWKERGFGKMKILRNPETSVVRLVMRREQVLKVCCNHRLTKDLEFSPLSTSDKAYKWATTDHSEDEPKAEIFSIRFKTSEKAQDFKNAIENAKMALSATAGESPKKAEEVKSSGSILVKHPAGSWECKGCYVRNGPNVITCGACSSPKPGATNPTEVATPKTSEAFNFGNFGIPFNSPNAEKPQLSVKHPEGSWECKSCYVRNCPNVIVCAACSSPKPGATNATEVTTPKTSETFSFGVPFNSQSAEKPQLSVKHPEGSWECEGCYVRNSGEVTYCQSCKSAKPGPESQTQSFSKFSFGSSGTGPAAPTYTFGIPPGSSTTSATAPTFASSTPQTAFNFGGPKNVFTFGGITAVVDSITESVPENSSWECVKCNFWNDVADTCCSKCSLEESPAAPADKFTMPGGGGGSFTFGCAPTVPMSGSWECHVCFNKNKSLDATCPACGTTRPCSVGHPPDKHSPDTGFLFSSNRPPFFGTPASADSNSKQGGNFAFKFTMSTNANGTSNSLRGNTSCDESDPEATPEVEEDLNVSFQPVITMPDEIKVVTGEEDEEVLYCQKARLFRYDPTSKEWKERGVGDVKILRHKETGKIRLLMRRESVLKLCLNHYLTDEIVLLPKAKDDKAWVWCASDFSEGVQTSESFAIRFRTPEIAQEFKAAVDKAKGQLSSPTKKDVSVEKEDGEKTSVSDSEQDSDVEIVYEQKVPPELVEKALSLQLPRNFYRYLQAPPCPGCPGCDKDEDLEDSKISTSTLASIDEPKEVPASSAPITPSSTPSESTKLAGQRDPSPFANLFGSIQLQDKPQSVSSSTPLFGSNQTIQSAGFSFAQKATSDSPVNNNTPFFKGKSSFDSTTTTSSTIFGDVRLDSEGSQHLVSPTPSDKPQEGLASQQTKQILKQSVLSNIVSGALTITPVKSSNDTQKDKPAGSKEMPQNSIFGNSTSTFANNTPLFASAVSFGGTKDGSKEMPKPLFGINMPSFASLATTGSPVSDSSNPTISKPQDSIFGNSTPTFANNTPAFASDVSFGSAKDEDFKWEGAHSKVFSRDKEPSSKNDSKNEEEKEEEEEEDEGAVRGDGEGVGKQHDPHFEPLIPLPDKIELKTGEEDELILFDERAKLYRYSADTKEWKERGVGNMKILKNKNSNVFRLLMRREQVYKIVCNHLIKTDLKMKKMSNKNEAFCWSAMNFGQDYETPEMENLSIKFKNVEIASKFKNIIDECILTLNKDADLSGAE